MAALRWNVGYVGAKTHSAYKRAIFKSACLFALALVSMSVVASEPWVIQENASAIDGATVKATKGYHKPNSNSYFLATIKCTVDPKEVEVTVMSFVNLEGGGAARVPDPYAIVPYTIVDMPAGRAKTKSGAPMDLGQMFALSSTARNTIVLNAIGLAESENAVPDDLLVFGSNAINPARAVRDALPMALELNNTAGQFELVIDASPEADTVLSRCGGDRPILDAREVAKFRALQQAHDERRRRGAEESQQREADPQQSLAARYAAALQDAVSRNWVRPDSVQLGQHCRLQLKQLPGGQVIDVQAEPSCPFDKAGRSSLESAVIKAEPLPYAGFEAVFNRSVVLDFLAVDR
jgi:hypothetical protein